MDTERLIRELKGRDDFIVASHAPMTASQLRSTEAALGFSLPPFLRQLYAEVGNGGFAPGYGVMGGSDGFTDDLGNTIVDRYRISISAPERYPWPDGLVDFMHWGCACYCAIDCLRPPHPIIFWDPGHATPIGVSEEPENDTQPLFEGFWTAFRLDADCLEDWYRRWLGGDPVMGFERPRWQVPNSFDSRLAELDRRRKM